MLDDLLLPLLLIIPLAGGLSLPFFTESGPRAIKRMAFFYSLLTFLVSLLLAFSYTWTEATQPQFKLAIPWIPSLGLSFGLAVIDPISMWLVLLTTFLMPLTILGSFSAGEAVDQRPKEFFLWLLVLEAAMLGVFLATDVIFFYICFEFTLIPMFFLIGIFGGTQRLKAARIFFLYTFTGSMLTLAGVLYVAYVHARTHGAWSFDIAALTLTARSLSVEEQRWILLAMLAGFAVKVPIFPVHTWLPLAHTEAPTAGSVILAGVLLKLGTYALLRLAIPMVPAAAVDYAPVIGTLAVIGILYTALICWVQKDIKKLIAYSSVSHLGFCVLGLFALGGEHIGQSGAVAYMVNHGLSTGALFLCVGMIYERFHTREMAQLGGLAKVMPIWAFFMTFFCFASVGLPGLNGFVGEFLTLLGAFLSDQTLGWQYAALAGVGMIFGAMYILYMAGKVIFGPLKLPHHAGDSHGHGEHAVQDLNTREIATLVPLALACLVLGLYPSVMLRTLDEPLQVITLGANRVLQARREAPTPVAKSASEQLVAKPEAAR